ncbi:MAG: hypothetical protein AABY49_01975 [Planctomycetota bacterium]
MEQIIKAKKILVRAPNWVGDVVMATPAFRCIRENFADSHITLLIKKNLRGIINSSPWFDEIIELGTKAGKSKNGFFLRKVLSGDMNESPGPNTACTNLLILYLSRYVPCFSVTRKPF